VNAVPPPPVYGSKCPLDYIVTMLGKGTRTGTEGLNLNVLFLHLKFCALTTGYLQCSNTFTLWLTGIYHSKQWQHVTLNSIQSQASRTHSLGLEGAVLEHSIHPRVTPSDHEADRTHSAAPGAAVYVYLIINLLTCVCRPSIKICLKCRILTSTVSSLFLRLFKWFFSAPD